MMGAFPSGFCSPDLRAEQCSRPRSVSGPRAENAWRPTNNAKVWHDLLDRVMLVLQVTPPTQHKETLLLCISHKWDPWFVTKPKGAWDYFSRLRLRVYSMDAEKCSYWTHGSPVCLEHITLVISVLFVLQGRAGQEEVEASRCVSLLTSTLCGRGHLLRLLRFPLHLLLFLPPQLLSLFFHLLLGLPSLL